MGRGKGRESEERKGKGGNRYYHHQSMHARTSEGSSEQGEYSSGTQRDVLTGSEDGVNEASHEC